MKVKKKILFNLFQTVVVSRFVENLTVFVCVKLLSRPDPAFSRIQQEGPDPTSRSRSDKKVRI